MAGIIAAVLLFAMLFSVGTGYFLFVNTMNTFYVKSLSDRATAMQAQLSENLQVTPSASALNHLTFTVTNTRGVNANVTNVFILSPTNVLQSLGIGFALNTSPTLPQPLNSGVTSPTFDTGLIIAAGTYTIKVVTQRGNVFVTTYPPPASTPAAGGNALLVQMVASPPQVLSGATVTDTVTVSNYGPYAATGVTLQPSPPLPSVTGTATLTGGICSPLTYASIGAYPGSGNPSSVVFVCVYTARTGSVGGFASFSGYAQGTMNGLSIASPQAISNTIQIGGSANVPTQGAFSLNAFYFKYSSCTNAPLLGRYITPCITNYAPMPPPSASSLPGATSISGGSNYYTAYYLQITNNFNATLPILMYSYIFVHPVYTGPTTFYLVGRATNPQTTYYPSYSGGLNNIPTFTPYTATQLTCAESPPNYDPPPPTTCIEVAPGGTITLTFAACGFGASNWDWGGSQYGQQFDNSAGCSGPPPLLIPPEGSFLSVVISFIYKGQFYTQTIPFLGQIILP